MLYTPRNSHALPVKLDAAGVLSTNNRRKNALTGEGSINGSININIQYKPYKHTVYIE